MHRLPIGRSILALLSLAVVWCWWGSRPVSHAPGVLVPEGPAQMDVPAESAGDHAGFQLTKVARYALRGRVLGTKRYYGGVQAPLVPTDVAVGWGRMSDQAVLDQLTLSMGNRFFFYRWRDRPPIPEAELMRSAANNHVVAASDRVASSVSHLRVGQIVEMQGWLVDATGPNDFRWRSSRKRDDTGNGACELFLVEALNAWNDPPTVPMQLALQK